MWKPSNVTTYVHLYVVPPLSIHGLCFVVQILATGVCHTDYSYLAGLDSESQYPAVLGHEGGGVVESVGEGVTSVKPGDHVIPLYIPQCRCVM